MSHKAEKGRIGLPCLHLANLQSTLPPISINSSEKNLSRADIKVHLLIKIESLILDSVINAHWSIPLLAHLVHRYSCAFRSDYRLM